MAKATDTGLAAGGALGPAAKEQLKGFKDRIINLLGERDELNESVKEVFNELGDAGFDKKIMRKAIRKLRMDPSSVTTEEEMIDSYVEAMGGLPLFQAAANKQAA